MVNEVTAKGLVVREAARWEDQGNGAHLYIKRPLKPQHVTNFFQATLRVISRYSTDAGDCTFILYQYFPSILCLCIYAYLTVCLFRLFLVYTGVFEGMARSSFIGTF